ncbi:transporter substrate-binding domain-containing protein [uncultured Methanospirillum sp.]|uniref:substrate-binding periplasmic protein n=1 Tax=uncultured Methanospirillum sp. TaxID=262503 RepID=UPI0029C84B8A|nr:transporter substrate-binding domain-containing protein [uncultured Methanospirillum sp.]
MSPDLPCECLVLVVVLAGILLFPGVLAENTSSVLPAEHQENLTLYSEPLPPYNYLENGTVKGFTIDILDEISAKTGTNISRDQVHIVPWEEGYKAARNGTHTVIFSTARISEREDLFKWVGPISTERYVLFAPHGSKITINTPDDLKDQKIGVITGDASLSQLLADGVKDSQFVNAKNVSDLISMTEEKKIDLWAYPEITGLYYIGEITGNDDSFTVVYPLEEVGIYFAFSKDISDATVSSYQRALDDLKQQKNETGVSRYDTIMSRYVHPEPVSSGQT